MRFLSMLRESQIILKCIETRIAHISLVTSTNTLTNLTAAHKSLVTSTDTVNIPINDY